METSGAEETPLFSPFLLPIPHPSPHFPSSPMKTIGFHAQKAQIDSLYKEITPRRPTAHCREYQPQMRKGAGRLACPVGGTGEILTVLYLPDLAGAETGAGFTPCSTEWLPDERT